MGARVFRNGAGKEVELTRGEFALLFAFVRKAGRVLSRAELRQSVDGGRLEAFERSVDMAVARLRRKIEPESGRKFIVTVAGAGYKFVPRVSAWDGRTPVAAADAVEAKPAGQAAERRPMTVLSCQLVGLSALAAQSRQIAGAVIAWPRARFHVRMHEVSVEP